MRFSTATYVPTDPAVPTKHRPHAERLPNDHAAALRQLLLDGYKLRTGPDGRITDVTGSVRLWQPNGDAARMAWFDLDTGELT